MKHVVYVLNPDIINNQDGLLIQACETKNEDVILFFYDKGADFNLENNYGKTPLDALSRQENLSEKLKSLKEKLILSCYLDEPSHGL